MKFIKKITILLICFLIVFAVIAGIEIILRTTHLFGARISWSEPDPTLGWRYTPNSIYWNNKENDHPITGKINNFGWRDKDWEMKKPSNTYRIALLGDSYVEAMQVESDRAFSALVEKALNKSSKMKIEVMNFGRSGFTQTDELIVLKKDVVRFIPDLVILFFLPSNDIDDVNKATSINLMRPFYRLSDSGELILDTSFTYTPEYKVKTLINWFKQHSALISLSAERFNLLIQERRIKKIKSNELGNRINGYLSLATDNPVPVYSWNYKMNKILIKEIANYCKGRGIKFMLVALDDISYIPAVEKGYKSIDPTFNSNFFEDDMEDYAGSLNIEYIGLQKRFRKYYEKNGILLRWNHWNYEGHKIVANILNDKVKSIIPKE